ncbi:putative Octanoyltransferase [Trypanosoma cruzi]|uniref:lipoyl(octanoyl) transferase n=2 Tax=Trypanosoma cruzi TaxID=5693 RepID=Q4DJD1_TRYCC|nr:lipoate protein ligase, putative [Trypanosoma cruzi]EAN92615.1 lipoate protein ligase, putative [Trypanosoma cruzi]PWV14150.1 putative Octanoyltransferase [Trypanosoma cruzi]RNC46234.1 lipoate protein ligase [Trypanosoma cruzi]|eukprot:XP_814466.1 lipoate protein ligase [Trypanosoma cruzi strain CL Brener]
MRAYFLGRRGYCDVLELQEVIFRKKVERQMQRLRGGTNEDAIPDTVLLVEHSSPVYTVGRRDTSEGIPKGCTVNVVKTRRGGGVTFHGPGQVTIYPIANIQLLWKHCTSLEKARSPIEWYSCVLEQAMIDTARDYNIPTHRGRVGVWSDRWCDVPPRKMGSIGLQLGNWVSMHGAGFNVCNDLRYFNDIIMCEMPDASATSLVEEMRLRSLNKTEPTPKTIAPLLLYHFLMNLRQQENIVSTRLFDLSDETEWQRCVLHGIE